jgi:alanine racemase
VTPAAVAVIRAAALRNNLQAVRDRAPGCRILAVIKANAYGHGLISVARILQSADGLAVARLGEAIQLRDAGIGSRIVVLGGFVGEEEAREALARKLDIIVHSAVQVDVLERLAPEVSGDLWLKVDTGMGRLGVTPPEAPSMLARLQRCIAGRGVVRLMTHLASADDGASVQTAQQIGSFESLLGSWRGGISVANSAAILSWPATTAADDGRENWLRPGLMLYGVSPLAGHSSPSLGLAPAMSFETRLIAVRRLSRGSRVGYGGDWQATRDSVIGVAAAGYADGYPWHRSHSTPVSINGRRAPVVGRVSMDMISIDLTDLPVAHPGDRVVLWGDDPPVEEVAQCAGTIAYELLAGMSPRVVHQVED